MNKINDEILIEREDAGEFYKTLDKSRRDVIKHKKSFNNFIKRYPKINRGFSHLLNKYKDKKHCCWFIDTLINTIVFEMHHKPDDNEFNEDKIKNLNNFFKCLDELIQFIEIKGNSVKLMELLEYYTVAYISVNKKDMLELFYSTPSHKAQEFEPCQCYDYEIVINTDVNDLDLRIKKSLTKFIIDDYDQDKDLRRLRVRTKLINTYDQVTGFNDILKQMYKIMY